MPPIHPAIPASQSLAPLDPSVKVSTAAALLDCDASIVRRLVREGKLPAHRIGKRGIRVFVSGIEEYRRARLMTGTAAVEQPPERRIAKCAASPAHHQAVAFLRSLGLA